MPTRLFALERAVLAEIERYEGASNEEDFCHLDRRRSRRSRFGF